MLSAQQNGTIFCLFLHLMKFKTAPAGIKFNFNGDNKSFPMNGVKFQALNIKCYTHEVITFGESKIIFSVPHLQSEKCWEFILLRFMVVIYQLFSET